MVGVYLSIWVRQGLLPHVHGTQVTSVGTGVLGYLGNKGGHCSMLLAGTVLCSARLAQVSCAGSLRQLYHWNLPLHFPSLRLTLSSILHKPSPLA